MNWTDIAVVGIILGSTYFGWRKGFIVAAIEFVKMDSIYIYSKGFLCSIYRYLS